MPQPQKGLTIEDLSPAQRQKLTAAYERLRRAAIEFAEQQDAEAVPLRDQAPARTKLENSETAYWRLREELLGERRAAWPPSAAFAADWFSDEDADHDADT